MKYKTAFHLIADVCNKHNVSCVLIGGFALNYYKVTRQTADIDFLITKADYDEIVGTLEKEGYKQNYAQEAFARLKSDTFYLMDIDFMFVESGILGRIIKDGKDITIAGQSFLVPSINHLIALKLHSMKHNYKLRAIKDLPDIVELVKVNNVDVNSGEFKELCLKYGTKGLYAKILEMI